MKKHKMTIQVELSVDIEVAVADGWIASTDVFAIAPSGKRVRLHPDYIQDNFKGTIENVLDSRDVAGAYMSGQNWAQEKK